MQAGEYHAFIDTRKLGVEFMLQIHAGDQVVSQKIAVINWCRLCLTIYPDNVFSLTLPCFLYFYSQSTSHFSIAESVIIFTSKLL
jgi:hypothetical protein